MVGNNHRSKDWQSSLTFPHKQPPKNNIVDSSIKVKFLMVERISGVIDNSTSNFASAVVLSFYWGRQELVKRIDVDRDMPPMLALSDQFPPTNIPNAPMSPKAGEFPDSRSTLNKFGLCPSINDCIEDSKVTEYSIDRQMNVIRPKLSDITLLDDDSRKKEDEVLGENVSSSIIHPIKLKHSTDLVTSSEILMASPFPGVNHVNQLKSEEELSIHDVVINKESHNVEMKVKVAGVLPINKPEILVDGSDDINKHTDATEPVPATCYKALNDYHVFFEFTWLNPNMFTLGYEFSKVAPEIIAKCTVTALRHMFLVVVPALVVFSAGTSLLIWDPGSTPSTPVAKGHSYHIRKLIHLVQYQLFSIDKNITDLGVFPTGDELSLQMLEMYGTVYSKYVVDNTDELLTSGVRNNDRVTYKFVIMLTPVILGILCGVEMLLENFSNAAYQGHNPYVYNNPYGYSNMENEYETVKLEQLLGKPSAMKEVYSVADSTNCIPKAATLPLCDNQVMNKEVVFLSWTQRIDVDRDIPPMLAPSDQFPPTNIPNTPFSPKAGEFPDSRSTLNKLGLCPSINDCIGDSKVTEYSINRKMNVIRPKLFDITLLDDDPRKKEDEVLGENLSSGTIHPIKLKHSTNLVTSSEILMASPFPEVEVKVASVLPIVKPEIHVDVSDDINKHSDATEHAATCYNALNDYHIFFESTWLNPNMFTLGYEFSKVAPEINAK
ncbi:fructose-bisphosphate aldolase, cytoplasmic isozyme 2 [Nicotiana attenuata]|uniref:fructose-bisphosphate aldolase n=1 Tax=Nicotiana attenuata TaxID=49451 RepID=A0A314KUP9_NICAT|nr:fructose-bisphosphate aldolase, cytoplasmic isozyme 2 [Nicotiana attenuata]